MKTMINQIKQEMVLNGFDLKKSLKTSSMIEILQLQLMNGTCHFLYRKKDGSIREAFGTLLEKVVDNNTNGLGIPRKYYNLQAYFDIEEQAWRSFRYENLITILS